MEFYLIAIETEKAYCAQAELICLRCWLSSFNGLQMVQNIWPNTYTNIASRRNKIQTHFALTLHSHLLILCHRSAGHQVLEVVGLLSFHHYKRTCTLNLPDLASSRKEESCQSSSLPGYTKSRQTFLAGKQKNQICWSTSTTGHQDD